MGLPLFLLSMSTVVLLEVGVGLLLFVSPGLLPAVTVILGVALLSLSIGLATGSRGSGPLRWRWLAAAGALVVAALATLGWTFDGGVPDGAVRRGGYLALLVALPMWGMGVAMAGLGRPDLPARAGAVAALGGASGAAVMGTVLVPALEPASVYLFCLLCVAVSAIVVDSRSAGVGAVAGAGPGPESGPGSRLP